MNTEALAGELNQLNYLALKLAALLRKYCSTSLETILDEQLQVHDQRYELLVKEKVPLGYER